MSSRNCPVCQVGVVEPVGYFELKEGPLEFTLDHFPPSNKATITIGLCNREPCQYVGTGTAPESLNPAKKLLKDLILSLDQRTRLKQ
ncbi:hypothetical protein [Paenibacillus periandrae]|uniref:hypothetical protein n=1 Tax=Paenibacillus periandrae TaxID=1761741 RepID=UPI001F091F39|nr:hypothetical protein [Paenibacillus periandrae]